jgi:hypothetical protein
MPPGISTQKVQKYLTQSKKGRIGASDHAIKLMLVNTMYVYIETALFMLSNHCILFQAPNFLRKSR